MSPLSRWGVFLHAVADAAASVQVAGHPGSVCDGAGSAGFFTDSLLLLLARRRIVVRAASVCVGALLKTAPNYPDHST